MHLRLVHVWSTQTQQAAIMRMLSHTLPRRAVYVSDGTPRGYRS
jgi:hypothetical protein